MKSLAASILMSLLLAIPVVAAAQATCSLDYILPADLGVTIPDPATDADFQLFAWRHFLALNAPGVGGQISTTGDNATQWSQWSSTADLLNQTTPGGSGSRSYPSVCQSIPDYQNYRAIQQVGKVDDSFLEAQTRGLSDSPVIDANGNFLRYEILLSPAMYNQIVAEGWNDPEVLANLTTDVSFICGTASYTGGDPADPQMGGIVLKIAWMDASGFTPEQLSKFHSEQLLVYNPGYRNSTGVDTCELKTMAMVGMHIAHKTEQQPNWIWATFEHFQNSPDCASLPDAPKPQQVGTNTNCPTSPGTSPIGGTYNLFPPVCAEAADTSCAPCNTTPAMNGIGECINPFDSPDAENGWCLDLPPTAVGGTSRLCKQVPIQQNDGYCSNDITRLCSIDVECTDGASCIESYPAVAEINAQCHDVIPEQSAWVNYLLIGSQWLAETFSTCQNNARDVASGPNGPVTESDLRELVTLAIDGMGNPTVTRPLLGNTTMESYDRPNCLGCHAKSYLADGGTNTDFMYFLKLEVAQPPAVRLTGTRFDFTNRRGKKRKVKLKLKSGNVVAGTELSADDPRCNDSPPGTVKATLRFHRDGQLLDDAIDLPCQGWKMKGKKSGRHAYRYKDKKGRSGPCRKIMIKSGAVLTATCMGAGLPADLHIAGDAGPLQVSLLTGRRRYCGEFADFSNVRGNKRRFASRRNARPGECAPVTR